MVVSSEMRLSLILFGLVLTAVYLPGSCRDTREQHSRVRRQIEWGPDIVGPYCETRPDGCCPGRMDDCSVPILDTLCYCDIFCNRTRGDCCPDFFTFCLGVRPTAQPIKGKSILLIHTVTICLTARIV